MMKTIIAGSRDLDDAGSLLLALEKCPWEITAVVCGMAKGADRLGYLWAELNDIPIHQFPANWAGLGKRAGYIRNEDMATFAEACIVLWDSESRGSAQMISLAKDKYKLPTLVYRYYEFEFDFYNNPEENNNACIKTPLSKIQW